jgi:PAS domain S-box-containing protein
MNGLDRNHPHLQLAMQAADIGFWEWDLITNKVTYSPEWKRQLGYAEDEISDNLEEWKSRLHPDDLPRVMQRDADFKNRRVPNYDVEFRLRHKDGSWRWLRSAAEIIRSKDGKPLRMVGCHIDITGRKHVEAENARNFRALQLVSDSNAALVRATDEAVYLNEVCRIAVDIGGYRMAWIGMAEHDPQRRVRPVAQAGFEAGYLESAAITWDECERGRGPVGTAIRTKQPSIIRDAPSHPNFRPWREEALKRGYQSCIALPLFHNGATWGALAAYSEEQDVFNDAELNILRELAQDVGFGIMALRARAERERATEALRVSERKLASAQRVAHLGHWEYEFDTDRLVWSEETYRIFGQNPQRGELTRTEFKQFVHPEDLHTLLEKVEQAAQGGPAYDFEYRVIRPNGEVRFVHSQGEVKWHASGRPRCLFGVAQDVTDRRLAEEALRASERRLEEAQRIAHVGHWDYNLQTKAMTWSDEAYRIFGLQPQQPGISTLKEYQEYIHPEDRQDRAEAVARAISTLTDYDHEHRLIRRNGEVRYIHCRGEVTQDAFGRPDHFMGTVQDVTERRQSEEALRESERRLAEAQRIAHVGHWEWNIDTDEILWSDETYRIKGVLPQSIHTLSETQYLVHPEDRPSRNEAIAQALRGGPRYDMEYRVVLPDGEVRFVHSQGDVRWDESGRPRRMFGTVQDITERKRNEEALTLAFHRIELAQQAALAAFYEFRPQTGEVIRSSSHEAVLGYSPEELKPTEAAWEAIIYPEDLAAFHDAVASAVREGDKFALEYRVRHKAGHYLWLSDHARVMRKEGGEVEGFVGMIRDITPRRLAEEGLRESERKLAEAQRVAHVGHWERDLDTGQILWSEETYRILGLNPRNGYRTLADFEALVHPEDRSSQAGALLESLRGGPRYDVEYRIIRPSGELRFVHSQCEVSWDAAGQPRRIFGTLQDITEQKLAEEALRRSTEIQRRAMEIALVSGFVYEVANGKFLLSKEAAALYGLPESMGMEDAWKYVHPDDLAHAQAAWQAGLAGDLYNVEYRAVLQGQTRWINARANPERDAEGRVVRIIGVLQDITERKRSEEALRRSMEIQRRAHEIAHLGGFTVEISEKTAFFSDEAAALFGLPPSLSMEAAWGMVHPDDLAYSQAQWQETLAGARYDIEHRLLLQGQVRWIYVRAEPEFDAEGRVVRIIGVLQDITDRRKLEEQLQQAQKMEAVGQFAAGIAHDFNNLMTVIIGYCYMLLRRLPPEDPLRNLVTESYKAAEQATTLTRQLVSFSRQQVMEPKIVDVNRVLIEMEKMLRLLVGENVHLVLKRDPAAGFIRVDPGQMQQILMNLCANARDAMPHGGTLTIATSPYVVDGNGLSHLGLEPGRYSLLSVTDTGIGMDDATKARIFEPFFTTKGPARGTGLGLPVVYGIVQQSRGQIEVSSELGHGTTFNIYLPLVEESAESAASSLDLATRMPEGKETVLLVEDDDALRELGRNILRSSGYTVREANNGQQAMQVVRDYPGTIDLLIADVVMPYLGGRALAKSVLALEPDIRVLLVSGHPSDAAMSQGVREADFPFLKKPFTPIALAQKVREVLDAKSPSNSANIP